MPDLPKVVSERDVPFYDVDSMQVVWHGHYVKYLERARCDLLEHIDYGYRAMRESGYAWPVVKLSLRYARPATFGQVLQIVAGMVEWEYRLIIDYKILDKDNGAKLASASSMQVAVDMQTRGTCLGTPPILEERLRASGYL